MPSTADPRVHGVSHGYGYCVEEHADDGVGQLHSRYDFDHCIRARVQVPVLIEQRDAGQSLHVLTEGVEEGQAHLRLRRTRDRSFCLYFIPYNQARVY